MVSGGAGYRLQGCRVQGKIRFNIEIEFIIVLVWDFGFAVISFQQENTPALVRVSPLPTT